MNGEELLMIFVKNPVKGKVKTRLAEAIGEGKALEIYKELLNHTKQITSALSFPKKVYYSDKIEPNDQWEEEGFTKALQPPGDLGKKMADCFEENLRNYEKVVIIGSDCPKLQANHIREAFHQLDKYDFVIGPAKDGGYYLLGMKNFFGKLFENKSWSTDKVLGQTLENIREKGHSYYLLEELNDIDTIEDLDDTKWEQVSRVQ